MKSTYSFDEHTEIYTFLTSDTAGADYELPKVMVDEILRYYSNIGGNMSVGQIASKLRMGLDMVKFVLKSMDVTHQTAPATQEDIDTHDLDELAETVVTTTRKAMFQAKVEKKIRKVEKEGYENWCALQAGTINPICDFLKTYVSTSLSKEMPKLVPSKSKNVLLVGMSDWHFGLFSSSSKLSFTKGWNVEEAKKCVLKYAAELTEYIRTYPKGFSEIKLLLMGDIIHGLEGTTDGKTVLSVESGYYGYDQLKAAYDAVTTFTEAVVETATAIGARVSIYSVAGNHM